jgi:Kef-type K+ transport system membrane component KefB
MRASGGFTVANHELGSVLFAFLLLMLGANLLGRLFTRFHQPKVVGEILAGVLLGPSLLGRLAPGVAAGIFGASASDARAVTLNFVYNLGLLLLMFVSGAGVRHVLSRQNRKPTAWILGVGTPLPFIAAALVATRLPLGDFMGPAQSRTAVALVFAAAAAVTSIPVIAKIFSDLGILHTRFAGLLLGLAVLEDILLWGVLSVATVIAGATLASGGHLTATIAGHIAVNALYIGVAMTIAPKVLRKLSSARWNTLAQHSPIAWMLGVMLGYVAIASALDVTLVFAAFLAGFGIIGGLKGTEQLRFANPLGAITSVASVSFIPVYFALVGYRLDFTKSFSPLMLAGFLVGSSALVLACRSLGARLAGFRGLDTVNIAVTANARGGPGIVMAGVAFDAGIISASFFTTLVLTAVLTSQAAGIWLGHVLRKGRPLLADDESSHYLHVPDDHELLELKGRPA